MDTLGRHRNNSGIQVYIHKDLPDSCNVHTSDHSAAPHHGSGRGLHNEVICARRWHWSCGAAASISTHILGNMPGVLVWSPCPSAGWSLGGVWAARQYLTKGDHVIEVRWITSKAVSNAWLAVNCRIALLWWRVHLINITCQQGAVRYLLLCGTVVLLWMARRNCRQKLWKNCQIFWTLNHQ